MLNTHKNRERKEIAMVFNGQRACLPEVYWSQACFSLRTFFFQPYPYPCRGPSLLSSALPICMPCLSLPALLTIHIHPYFSISAVTPLSVSFMLVITQPHSFYYYYYCGSDVALYIQTINSIEPFLLFLCLFFLSPSVFQY